MTKQKLIFLILGVLLLLIIIFLAINLTTGSRDNTTRSSGGSTFTIWMLHDDVQSFGQFVQSFKETYPSYSSRNIIVESFSDEGAYKDTLTSAFLAGTGPDMFVVNNSDTSVFENQILAISPSILSPNEFRQKFPTAISEDLIVTSSQDETVEFLKGVPAGFETLGLIYNRKYFIRTSEVKTWSTFSKVIQEINNRYTNIVPLALGNADGVSRLWPVMESFFTLEGANELANVDSTIARQVLTLYKTFGAKDGDNRYDVLVTPYSQDTDIDFFTQGDVVSMMGYPRDLMKIREIGYQRTFLFASHFPSYDSQEVKLAIDYNYFAINADSASVGLAQDFASYITSNQGQEKYNELYPYYIPSSVEYLDEIREKKIFPEYNIVYNNFVPEGAELVSFAAGDESVITNEIQSIVNMDAGFDNAFAEVTSQITCRSNKHSTLLNLSSSCK